MINREPFLRKKLQIVTNIYNEKAPTTFVIEAS